MTDVWELQQQARLEKARQLAALDAGQRATFDASNLPHRIREARGMARVARVRIRRDLPRSSGQAQPRRRRGERRLLPGEGASSTEARIVSNDELGVAVTLGPGTLPEDTAVRIEEVPACARWPLPAGGVRIPRWIRVKHKKTFIRADGSSSTINGMGKGTWEMVEEATMGAEWRDAGPCFEVTPHAHEEAHKCKPMESWALVRVKHSGARYKDVQVLHATARGLDAGQGWKLVSTDFRYVGSIMVRVRELGYFRVVMPKEMDDTLQVSCFRRALLGGRPGGTVSLSVWLHPSRPDVTNRIEALEADAVAQEVHEQRQQQSGSGTSARQETAAGDVGAMDADGSGQHGSSSSRTHWDHVFDSVLPQHQEATQLRVHWDERIRISLGQEFESTQGFLEVGAKVLARPRQLNKAGKMMKTRWAANWVVARVLQMQGGHEMQTGGRGAAAEQSAQAAELRFTLLFADGHEEKDVPRDMVQQLRSDKALQRENEYSGGNSCIMRWRGEPVRATFEVDIPQRWSQPEYKERVWLTCVDRDPRLDFEQVVHFPMDAVHTGAASNHAFVSIEEYWRQQRQAERDTRERDVALSADVVPQQPDLYVPASVRFRTGGVSALTRLHRTLGSRSDGATALSRGTGDDEAGGVGDTNGDGGGEGDGGDGGRRDASAEAHGSLHGDLPGGSMRTRRGSVGSRRGSRRGSVSSTLHGGRADVWPKSKGLSDRLDASGRPPYCHLCQKRVECHHFTARRLKRERRERMAEAMGLGAREGRSGRRTSTIDELAIGVTTSASGAMVRNPVVGWLGLS